MQMSGWRAMVPAKVRIYGPRRSKYMYSMFIVKVKYRALTLDTTQFQVGPGFGLWVRMA